MRTSGYDPDAANGAQAIQCIVERYPGGDLGECLSELTPAATRQPACPDRGRRRDRRADRSAGPGPSSDREPAQWLVQHGGTDRPADGLPGRYRRADAHPR